VGLEHPDVAEPLWCLAVLYHRKGQLEGAEKCYLQIMAVIETSQGPEQMDLIPTLYGYADLLSMTGRIDEGKRLRARADAIVKKLEMAESPMM
jgi:hypothetical protein